MPKGRTRKTRDELIDAGIRMYRNLPQYRDKLLSGEMDDEDLFIMASKYADNQIAAREKRLTEAAEGKTKEVEADDKYREKQEAAYRKGFSWDSPNDEASLQHLLDLEVQIKHINDELNASSDPDVKDKLRRALPNTVKEHRSLQEKLGIDKVTRGKAAAARNTVDDWDRIKQEAKQKLKDLSEEFALKVDAVTSEAELRDRMKYHFAIPFFAVDSILANHRRVLGLDVEVEKS